MLFAAGVAALVFIHGETDWNCGTDVLAKQSSFTRSFHLSLFTSADLNADSMIAAISCTGSVASSLTFLQLLALSTLTLIGSTAQHVGDLQHAHDVPPPGTSASLIVSHCAIPFGRAQVVGPIRGACILNLDVTARAGTLDVVVMPAGEWREWATCRSDLPPERVVCRGQRLCRVEHHAVDRLEDTVLLVGRSRINIGANATVKVHVRGAPHFATEAVFKILFKLRGEIITE